MKINWKVRFKNKAFWISVIPAVLVLVQAIAKLFGYELNFDEFNENMLNIVNAVFVVLSILGIVTDHTTKGFSDSNRALTYTEPKE